MSDLWYKNAVFYEVYVRAFFDSNGDGHGDLKGLIQKLDYLKDLGVDCIWLLPIYPSPLRDDGYDIADYYNVLPTYGSLEDFHELVNAVHARRMRLITDLVLNHTSDQHPWFQSARASRRSPYRDYYVWSDTDQKYREARIISWIPKSLTGHGMKLLDNTTGTVFILHSQTSIMTIPRFKKKCGM